MFVLKFFNEKKMRPHKCLVWIGSINVGFGLNASSSANKDGSFFLTVVCNYKPPGNFNGEFTNNVLRA